MLPLRLRLLLYRLWHWGGAARMGPLTPELFNRVMDHCSPMPEARRINALWSMLGHRADTSKVVRVRAVFQQTRFDESGHGVSGLQGSTTLAWQGALWCNHQSRWTRDYMVFIHGLNQAWDALAKTSGTDHTLDSPRSWRLFFDPVDAMEAAPDSRAWMAEFEAVLASLRSQDELDHRTPKAALPARVRRHL